MSYYYNYYLGYKDASGKIYPLGPYNKDGKLITVLSRSSSFASHLHHSFWIVNDDKMSDELKKEFTYTEWDGKENCETIRFLPYEQLPKDHYIKRGYFLIDDVKQYEENGNNAEDLFYETVTPTVYAAMAANEAQFGKPADREDDDGNKFTPYTASDYMFYAYPNYFSEEYEAAVIRIFGSQFEYELKEGQELVVLETEG